MTGECAANEDDAAWVSESSADESSSLPTTRTDSDPWKAMGDKAVSTSSVSDPPFKDRRLFQKDRGWGWMCVLGSFIIQMLEIGAAKSFGVLFSEFVELYQCDIESATWISALNGFFAMCLGPFSTCIGVKYSNRSVVMVGGLLVCIGFVLSAFATSIPMLYTTLGVLVGTGMGLSFAPSIVILSQYFEKRRALANGMAVAGCGVGNFVVPYLYRFLIETFGLRGCLIIYGGICLNICVCGALFRPLEEPFAMEVASIEDGSDEVTNDAASVLIEENGYNPSASSSWADVSLRAASLYELPASEWPEEDCCGCKACYTCLCFMPSKDPNNAKGRALFDFSLLSNAVFHVYFWAVLFASIGHSSLFVMLPPNGLENGFSKDRAALLVSIVGAFDLLGRVVFGWVSDLKLVRRKHGFYLAMGISGCFAVLFPATSYSFTYQAPVCAVFGIFGGSYIALTAVVLEEALGAAKLPNTFGLTVMGQGFGMLMAFPSLGAIRAYTGSWDVSFYLCSGLMILGAMMSFIEPFAIKRMQKKQRSHSMTQVDCSLDEKPAKIEGRESQV
ncbi:hypothetical protein CAPTEDRAFT_212808 [Capitella teleta]|uniref:Major facilitator superfamily (MFS) profile domain-containing protein n=1 Tax=Capitella teleta TaxID=283909 RepID=R7T6S2_CAPTE|nr:hypothetical protein CAPTEDRAFT_212808 [Capitella teleta]|eukprot:ELT89264.1 hypothetical protein CAPTEDRAFT_212808 [Capitella teleta]